MMQIANVFVEVIKFSWLNDKRHHWHD